MYANGGYIPNPEGTDSVPIRLGDREQIITPDGKVFCHHAVDGQFHDHGQRVDMATILDRFNRA